MYLNGVVDMKGAHAVRRAWRVATAATVLAVALPAQEKVDVATIERIKAEEMQRSQVMDIVSWLTDVHGPRLTGSPITKMAGAWAVSTMSSWGLSNPHLETWGPFGRGWTNEHFSFNAVSPHAFAVKAEPRAWSPGTNGKVTGAAMSIKVDSLADLAQYAGKLRGKFLLVGPVLTPTAHFAPEAARLSDAKLDSMAAQQPAVPAASGRGRGGGPPAVLGGGRATVPFVMTRDTAALRWLEKEGVGAVLVPARGDGGIIFTDNGNPRSRDAAQVPFVHVAEESYGRIMRMLDRKMPVTLELDMQNRFYDDDPNSFNVIAEVPGSDPQLKDEVVMIGAHFDSWHSGTGATDNAAGSAVMLEAMRLIKTLGLQPRRTIRIGLWTGEEQGLLGSRAYVREHFGSADSTGLHPMPEHAKFAAYFNVDNGTGKIRGVYLQGNEMVAPLFSSWMEPFHDLGMNTLTIRNTGGTDHLSFNAVRLPGFQFIQDPLDYDTRTHHSNMDVYERIQEPDMKQMAVIVASFVYMTANRDEMLPRKPLPKSRPPRPQF